MDAEDQTAVPDALNTTAAPETGVAVVLFDFDGVVVRGDAFGLFIRAQLRRSWWRGAAMLAMLPVALPMLATAGLRPRGLRLLVRLGLLGWKAARFRERVGEFGRELAHQPGVMTHAALDSVRDHLRDGARVVVVTACEETLVRAVLTEFDLAGVELIASRVGTGRLGLRATLHNYGTEKARQLASHGLSPPWEAVYSDSLTDLPMLLGARRSLLVNPTGRRLARARHALGSRVTPIYWP